MIIVRLYIACIVWFYSSVYLCFIDKTLNKYTGFVMEIFVNNTQ